MATDLRKIRAAQVEAAEDAVIASIPPVLLRAEERSCALPTFRGQHLCDLCRTTAGRCRYAAAPTPPAAAEARKPIPDDRVHTLWLECAEEVARLELEQRYAFAAWFRVAVHLVEREHGIGALAAHQKGGGE